MSDRLVSATRNLSLYILYNVHVQSSLS